jgi:site-specific recombinase XerD
LVAPDLIPALTLSLPPYAPSERLIWTGRKEERAMTPLRQRMLEDMQIRNLSKETQISYVNHVARFARHFRRSPEHLGLEDIRTYQLHLMNDRQLAATSVAGAVAALRFLYQITLKREWRFDAIAAPKRGDTLPIVLSPEEVVRFLGCVADPKHRVILTTCYAGGLRLSEALHLRVDDVDSGRMILRVAHGKGNRDRYVMLSPTLLEELRTWWRATRPSTWLFPGQRPGQPMDKGAVQWACRLARVRSRLTKPVTPHSLRTPSLGDDGALPAPRHDEGVLGDQPARPPSTSGRLRT